jgi:phosphoribosylamine--glycine ligase
MNVLVVGGGGREHAIVWSLAQNTSMSRIFVTPGNAGMEHEAVCLPIPANDVAEIAAFAEKESVDLTIVGPEGPLVEGLVDEMESRGLPVFGPTREGAQIEGSKAWAKDLCERYGIPHARARAFTDFSAAMVYLDELEPPYVVKADGLAAGKGVAIVESRIGAEQALHASLVDRAFGRAGDTVLVEEFITGREVSAFAITDGKEVVPLVMAQDFKRVGDGDEGPNTGGMGAYSPVPWVDDATAMTIWWDVLTATVRAMRAEGVIYRGILYAGLMLTDDGPKVLEYNCRFGDPETQVIVPRLRSDLAELLLASVEGNLRNYKANWKPEACVTVVAASGGYPGEYATGVPIEGIEEAEKVPGAVVFHAGTALQEDRVVTAGGRVLSVSGLGASIEDARVCAYEALGRISFEGMHHRGDIARAVEEAR